MNEPIYDPLEEYKNVFEKRNFENSEKYFQKLVDASGIDIEKNRETVKLYNEYKENLKKLKRKFNFLRFLRVISAITILLIPLVIFKLTPEIKKLRTEIQNADEKSEQLLSEAYAQMLPLNSLFSDRDALNIIENTIPLLSFDESFSAQKENDMKINYDFYERNENEQSTLDVLSGSYNGNPFLFENKTVHTVGTQTYYGYKTISWTETYRDSDGKMRTRRRTQTLQASVIKPKPFYNTRVVLNYGAQGSPELSFSRTASHIEKKNSKEVEKYIKKGQKKLKKLTDDSVKNNRDFVSMSNTDFEVLFNALNRTNEVQYRAMFTPLAQTNMVDLMLSDVGYGDDFNFIKEKRMNTVSSEHSQGRTVKLNSDSYKSYSFDIIKESFINNIAEYFKKVYFDFAPIWAIPVYQEKPVHSLKPLPDSSRMFSQKDCEALANKLDTKYVVHPDTKTQAILKAEFVNTEKSVERTRITAYSYDIIQREDIVSVRGDDGHYHNVIVPWDDYIPLEESNDFFVAEKSYAKENVIACMNNLCMFR